MDKYKVLNGEWWCAGDHKAVRKTVKLLLRGKDGWKEDSEDSVGEPWEYRRTVDDMCSGSSVVGAALYRLPGSTAPSKLWC